MKKTLDEVRIELEDMSDQLYHEVQGESKLGNQLQDLADQIGKHVDAIDKALGKL